MIVGIFLTFIVTYGIASWINSPITENDLEKELLETRKNIIKFLWKDEQLPSHVPQHIETDIDDEIFNKLGHVKQIDRFTVDMKHGVNSIIFLIHPEIQTHDELIIYHNGHGLDLYEGKNTIRFFIEKGYPVLVITMPLESINNNPTVIVDGEPILLESHPYFSSIESEEFTPFSYFFEPLAVTLNFLDKEYEFKKYHMMGISGGGWTSSIYPAIDERISTSFSVAGGVPLEYYRAQDFDHWEGHHAEFFSIASYYDIYALDTLGGRKFIQIFNSDDPCCWGKGQDFGFIKLVAEKVSKLENSYYRVFLIQNQLHKIIPETTRIIFEELDDENLEYFQNTALRKSNNDFSLENIKNMYLRGVDLQYADFSGTLMNATDLSNSDLAYSTFFKSQSHNTDFSNSDLSFTDFSYSIIKGAVFENTLLRNVDFQYAFLENIDFRHSLLEDINFKQTACYKCNFDGINIQSIKTPTSSTYNNFAQSSFRGVDFRGWDYHKIDFMAKTRMTTASSGKISEAYYGGTILSNADFSEMDLTRIVFSRNGISLPGAQAQLDGANLSQSNLSRNDLRYVVLSNANLEGANLEGANLEGANLEGANLNCMNHPVCN